MAHPDLEELLNFLVPFAQQMLAKHGEFFPFAATMGVDGKIAPAAAHTGSEQPPSQEVIDLLLAGFRRQAARGEIRAAGLCVDVRTVPPGETEKVDAICTRLEHREGDAVHVFLPYRKGWLGRVKYGELFAGRGERVVFAGEHNSPSPE
jgi:hypothetical protein